VPAAVARIETLAIAPPLAAEIAASAPRTTHSPSATGSGVIV
jgi:hypothetical protein